MTNITNVIDDQQVSSVVLDFYSRVRQDEILGPVFNNAIHDWQKHLTLLTDFWSSVMMASGRYKGNPMMKHMIHAQHMTPVMFHRWLHIWQETTSALLPPEIAQNMQQKAHRIAESLQMGVSLRPPAQEQAIRKWQAGANADNGFNQEAHPSKDICQT